eukprot:5902995-Amphidinium_carterae.1
MAPVRKLLHSGNFLVNPRSWKEWIVIVHGVCCELQPLIIATITFVDFHRGGLMEQLLGTCQEEQA